MAVFDSGVGGLTVLHECLVSLPHEDFLYLGDTARFPYGDRSPDELLGFARELAGILLERGAKLLVVACNSATAAALPALRESCGAACRSSAWSRPSRGWPRRHAQRQGRPARHAGHGGERRLRARARRGGAARPSCTRWPRAELAPLIQEGGEVDAPRGRAASRAPAGRCGQAGVDTVILGCTHYPLVRPVLQRELGRGVTIVSSGEAIAAEVERAAARAPALANDEDRRGALPLPRHRRPRGVPPPRHALPPAADRRGRARGRARPRRGRAAA